MPQEDLQVHSPTSDRKEKDYDASDVEAVFRRGEWKNCDDVVNWLRKEGDDSNELTPGEVKHMVADFERLKSEGAEFNSDPDKVFEMAKKGR